VVRIGESWERGEDENPGGVGRVDAVGDDQEEFAVLYSWE